MRRPPPTGSQINVTVPVDLHPASKDLVRHFATAMADKLKAAEIKYGYRAGWKTDAWEAECRQHMLEHIDKGDPSDVAIYCAFMWSRGWSTSEPCEYCGSGKSTGLPGNACENCMNTGLKARSAGHLSEGGTTSDGESERDGAKRVVPNPSLSAPSGRRA